MSSCFVFASDQELEARIHGKALAKDAWVEVASWTSGESIEPYVTYLGDKNGLLSFEEIVRGKALFHPLEDKALGFNIHTHWYRIPLDYRLSLRKETDLERSKTTEWYLSTGLPSSPLVRAYWVTDNGIRMIFSNTSASTYHERPINHHGLMIPLTELMGEKGFLYIENQSIAGYPLSLRLYEKDAFHYLMADYTLLNGMLLGGIAIFFVFFFLQFIVQPSVTLGLYSLFIFSMGLFVSQVFGYNFQYLWPEYGEFNNHFTSVIGGFTYVWYFLFSIALFNVKERCKPLYWVTLILSWVTAVISLTGLFTDVSYLNSLLALIGLPVPVIIGVWALKNHLPSARFFLAGSSMHCGVTYVLIIACLGVDVGRLQTVFSLVGIGQVLDLSLFAMAIFYQTKQLREQLNKHLHQRIADMEALVNTEQATKATQERSQAHVLNLATTTHDLQQPLAAIGLALSTIEGEGNQRAKKQIEMALQYSRELLNSVLHDSKSNYHEIRRSVNLPALLADVASRHATRTEEKGLSLRTYVGKVGDYLCLPILLNRVLDNLLTNAVRYTSRGGILLSVRPRNGGVVIQVWDTGQGMPRSKIKDILAPFKQLSQAEIDSSGFGLGLYIVKTLCQKAGYHLSVTSQLNRGSCFSVFVPCVSE